MEDTFFDEEFVKSSKIVSCPCCNKKFKIDLNDKEVFCNECGNHFEVELNEISDDFVWHPTLKY
jgi:transcription elongation factor Elf1